MAATDAVSGMPEFRLARTWFVWAVVLATRKMAVVSAPVAVLCAVTEADSGLAILMSAVAALSAANAPARGLGTSRSAVAVFAAALVALS